jgi:transposase InsO family protein
MVFLAFAIDAYSSQILGWRAARSMRTELVLDALEHAVWTRAQTCHEEMNGPIMHTDAGSQYPSIAYTERLAVAGAAHLRCRQRYVARERYQLLIRLPPSSSSWPPYDWSGWVNPETPKTCAAGLMRPLQSMAIRASRGRAPPPNPLTGT